MEGGDTSVQHRIMLAPLCLHSFLFLVLLCFLCSYHGCMCVSLWLLWPSRSFQQQTVPAGFVVGSVAQRRIWEPTSCSPSSHPGANVSSQGQQHNPQQHNQQEQQKQKHQQHQQHQQQRHQQQQQQGYCSVDARRCRPFMAFFVELMQYHRVPERSGGTCGTALALQKRP